MRVNQDDCLEELANWLVDALQAPETTAQKVHPQLVETWRSRTAVLHHFRWPNHSFPDVVVKIHQVTSDARMQYESMRRLARALEAVPESAFFVVDPLGMSPSLGAVLMPYVPGISLADMLRRTDWSSEAARHGLAGLVRNCGVLLAGYHGGTVDLPPQARQVAHHRLRARVERILGHRASLSHVAATGPVVQSYRDFHPGHMIVTGDRRLALIDPPVETRYDYCYRDLALFSYNLYMNLIDPREFARSPLRVRHHEFLVKEFLDGYANSAGRDLTNDDVFFIHGWEAYYLSRMLRAAWQRHSYGFLTYYLLPMNRRLHRLRRNMVRHVSEATS
jgi:hypothetical protein